jgi:hypothetical protein
VSNRTRTGPGARPQQVCSIFYFYFSIFIY